MTSMISTEDNPHDPREDFPSWHAWDIAAGYNTCAYLDRVANLATEMPEIVQDRQREDAIDEIIREHNGRLYVKLEIQDSAA